jgi:hypothetical protein
MVRGITYLSCVQRVPACSIPKRGLRSQEFWISLFWRRPIQLGGCTISPPHMKAQYTIIFTQQQHKNHSFLFWFISFLSVGTQLLLITLLPAGKVCFNLTMTCLMIDDLEHIILIILSTLLPDSHVDGIIRIILSRVLLGSAATIYVDSSDLTRKFIWIIVEITHNRYYILFHVW